MLPITGHGDGSGSLIAMATTRGVPRLCPLLERLGPLLPCRPRLCDSETLTPWRSVKEKPIHDGFSAALTSM